MSMIAWEVLFSKVWLLALCVSVQVRSQQLNGVPVISADQIASLQQCLGADAVQRVQRSLDRWQQPCLDVWNSPVWNRRRLEVQGSGRQWEEVLWRLVFREDLTADGGSVSPVPCIPPEGSATSMAATVSSSAATASTSSSSEPTALPVTPFTLPVSTASSATSPATTQTTESSVLTSASTTALTSSGTTSPAVTPFTLPTSTSTPSPPSSSSTTTTQSTSTSSSTTTLTSTPGTIGPPPTPFTLPTSTASQSLSSTPSTISQSTSTSTVTTSSSTTSSTPAQTMSTMSSNTLSTSTTSSSSSASFTQSMSTSSTTTASAPTTTTSAPTTTASAPITITSAPTTSLVVPMTSTTERTVITSVSSPSTSVSSSMTSTTTAQTLQPTTQAQGSGPGSGSETGAGGNSGGGTSGGTGGSYGGVNPPSTTESSSIGGPTSSQGANTVTVPGVDGSRTTESRTTAFPFLSTPRTNHNGTGGGTGGSYGGTLPDGNFPNNMNPYGWFNGWSSPWAYGNYPGSPPWGRNPRIGWPQVINSRQPRNPWFGFHQMPRPMPAPPTIDRNNGGRWFWPGGHSHFDPHNAIPPESEVGFQPPAYVPPPPPFPFPSFPPFPYFPPYGMPWYFPQPPPYANFQPMYPQNVLPYNGRIPNVWANFSHADNETLADNFAFNRTFPPLVWCKQPHFHTSTNRYGARLFPSHFHWHINDGQRCLQNTTQSSNETQSNGRVTETRFLKSGRNLVSNFDFPGMRNPTDFSGQLSTGMSERRDNSYHRNVLSELLMPPAYGKLRSGFDSVTRVENSKGKERSANLASYLSFNNDIRNKNIPDVDVHGTYDVFSFIELASELLISNQEVIPKEEFFDWLDYRVFNIMSFIEEPWAEEVTEGEAADDRRGRSFVFDDMDDLMLLNDEGMARQTAVQSTAQDVFVVGCQLRGARFLTETDELDMVTLNQTLNSFAIPNALRQSLLQNRQTCLDYSDSIVVEELIFPLHNELGRQLAFFQCALQQMLTSCERFQQLQEAFGGTP